MNWTPNTDARLIPKGGLVDIIVVRYGKPKRFTNCKFLRSLEVFRTEIGRNHIPMKDVKYWQVVELPAIADPKEGQPK